MAGSFFDTNILVYVASADAGKADRCEAILAEGGTVSVQVLNELANVGRRKMHLSWAETRALLSGLRGLLTISPITLATHEAGLAFAERYNLTVYDALIVASAIEAGCDTLWSEDMQHGMAIEGGLRIVNPFRS